MGANQSHRAKAPAPEPNYSFNKLAVELQLEIWRYATQDWISTLTTDTSFTRCCVYAQGNSNDISRFSPLILLAPTLPGMFRMCHLSRNVIHDELRTFLFVTTEELGDRLRKAFRNGTLFAVKSTLCDNWSTVFLRDFRMESLHVGYRDSSLEESGRRMKRRLLL